MVEKQYNSIIEFIGKEEKCYAIIKKFVGNETFKDLQKQYAGVCLDEFNGDVSSTSGNVFFMKRAKNAKGNTLLFKEKDLPMPVGSIGVFLVTAELVEKKISHTRYLKERKKLQKQNIPEKELVDMKKLRSMPYEDFLKTKYWDRVRKMKIKQSGCKCQMCGKKDIELHVHHNSYEHHGDEANHLEDLVVLCKNCHNLFHRTSHLKH